MHTPTTPRNERARLEVLRALDVLDTEPDAELDDLTQLAAQVCGTPVALLSLIDEHRQWFKSNVGFHLSETSRDIAFCAHAILDEGVLEINDATQDARFRENALVTGAPFVRFYAGAPLETNDGFNIGTVCVIDTVPRKLSPLQRNALRLLARSAMRTLELRKTAHALGRALLREQEVGDSKAWLSAYVAHESRNMLMVLGGMLDLLGMSKLDAAQVSALHAAQNSAEILGRLMQDVLDLTRSDSRALSVVERPFDVGLAIERMGEQYETRLRMRGVALRVELAPSLPKLVTGDVKRLEQVLHNLLGNAAKFTREGEVVLRAKLQCSDEHSHTLRFEVSDQGPGLDDSALASLFEPYRPGASHAQSGTGLGLYIARQIVEQMGGTIGAENRVGRGSTFYFVLRFLRATDAD